MARFDIWGDEIAYDHRVVGRLTLGATTLRDDVEESLLGVDPAAFDRQLSEAIEENRQEWSEKVDELESEVADLKAKNEKLLAALDAIDGGRTIADLQAELAEAQKAIRAWRNKAVKLHEAAKKPRKRRA